jgi:hypothetical protein
LLIEGDAKRNYIRHRNSIKSFDDFYEFLLTNYDNNELNTYHTESRPLPHSLYQNNYNQSSSTRKSISFENSHKTTASSFNLADHLPPRPILRSTALVDVGSTSLADVGSEKQSAVTSSLNTSNTCTS